MCQELGGGLLHWACMTTSNSVPLRSFDIVVARHVDTVLFLLAEEDMDVNMASTVDQSTPLMVRGEATAVRAKKSPVCLSLCLSCCLVG